MIQGVFVLAVPVRPALGPCEGGSLGKSRQEPGRRMAGNSAPWDGCPPRWGRCSAGNNTQNVSSA